MFLPVVLNGSMKFWDFPFWFNRVFLNMLLSLLCMRVIVREQSVSNSCSCVLEVLPVCGQGVSVEGNLFSLAARFFFFYKAIFMQSL